MGIFRKIIDILLPRQCLLCHEKAHKEGLCRGCYDKFVSQTFEHCDLCGKTPINCKCGTDFTLHTQTAINNHPFSCLTFYRKGVYDEKDRVCERMIYQLKDNGSFAALFAEELARQIKTEFTADGKDITEWIVTYPPRSAKNFRKYGFDQGEMVARFLAKELGIKLEKTFVRTESGSIQKGLDGEERRVNAEESLLPLKNHIIKGGKYIVFDDIITTGATMETVAKNLYFYGADEVFPVAIAKTASKKAKTNE